jgi:hypothetical protein
MSFIIQRKLADIPQ